MTLRLLGQANSLGGGTHFQEFLSALRQVKTSGATVEAYDPFALESLALAAAQSTADDINIWFWPDRNAGFFEAGRSYGVFLRVVAYRLLTSRCSRVSIEYGYRAVGGATP